jgi:hypothetical protein
MSKIVLLIAPSGLGSGDREIVGLGWRVVFWALELIALDVPKHLAIASAVPRLIVVVMSVNGVSFKVWKNMDSPGLGRRSILSDTYGWRQRLPHIVVVLDSENQPLHIIEALIPARCLSRGIDRWPKQRGEN